MSGDVVAGDADLTVDGLNVKYGQFQALFDVSLGVETGSCVAVLGPNGAGKSTLGRALCGLVPGSSGRVTFGGTDITNWRPDRIRRAGLAYIPEGRGIFPGLSVQDNLRMAARQSVGREARRDAITRATELFPLLAVRGPQRAGSLSGGEQQMLGLARALAARPKLIIADEMSLGLAPIIVERVFENIETVRREGISIILIEQFIHRALAIADACVILSGGRVDWSGPAHEAKGEVVDRYLGESNVTSSS